MYQVKVQRIKQLLERGYNLGHSNANFLVNTIEELEKELVTVKSTKEIVVELPPLPESDVITLLQKQIQSLQLQLSTKQQMQKRAKHISREWEYFSVELRCSQPEYGPIVEYYKVKLNPLTGQRAGKPFMIDYLDYMDETEL